MTGQALVGYLAAATARTLHVSRLRPHPGNVREDLGDLSGLVTSILQHGILQPLVVEPQPLSPGQFLIIAGHRRYAAARKAGLDMVPVVFRDAGEWEPDHFTPGHQLAKKAKALCEAREHTLRRRVGKTACGQCWETVIRADERIAAEVLRDERTAR